MSNETSIDRYSFVATFELIAGGRSYSPTEIAPEWVTLASPTEVPPGPAELIVRYDDRPEVRHQIEVIGPVHGDPTRIAIQR